MSEEVKWIEVWIDTLAESTLILKAKLNDKFEIRDPVAKETHIFDTYKDAYYWLRADEYERLIGQYHNDLVCTPSLNELTQRAMEIREKFGDFELANGERKWTREDVMMGFVGDVGDLAKLVMAHQNIRNIPDKQAKLEHELADCLWSIMVLAKMYDIDLESAFLKTANELEKFLDEQKNGS